MATRGYIQLAKALAASGTDTLFYLMGGPIVQLAGSCAREGIRTIDFRHEQGASFAAHAYARVTGRPGVITAASGPGVTNLVTGVSNAYQDCAPLVVLGGAAPLSTVGMGEFQSFDQLSIMRPVTKWAVRATEARRLPELLATAFREATTGQPGPVYIDLPGDVLFERFDDEGIALPERSQFGFEHRPAADEAAVERAVEILSQAERPIVVSGSGILWSKADQALHDFVEETGVPFYTTPLGRGVIPEDHPLAFLAARSTAFREADVVVQAATRQSFVIGFARPPRFSADAKFIQIDISANEIGRNRAVEVGLVGDARRVLEQLTVAAKGRVRSDRWTAWVDRLRDQHRQREERASFDQKSNQVPIHPQRVLAELRDLLPRAAILCVDGHETLNFARQVLPTHVPGHRLNPGISGCMGIAVPLGVGAKAAKPDTPVVVLSGDGSFGMNGYEVDTAIRHRLPLTIVMMHNGGWAGAVEGRKIPGRDLGLTRHDKVVEALGGEAAWVERPEDIRPAIEKALRTSTVSIVCVVTDPLIRSETMAFGGY
ncbi:MAG TPA: thiamine pyrophosphate-binding protein [Dehalococcoidia bacterium]|nr:thiamine pyrophosphate-binding protein [Dehalococcoidia bacterium]